jgi:hypothetical protein
MKPAPKKAGFVVSGLNSFGDGFDHLLSPLFVIITFVYPS